MTKTTEEYAIDYIRAIKTLEDEMEPYKEHKRELKTSYIENGWLSKEDISLAVKAYRLMKSDIDLEKLGEYCEKFRKM